jgi:phage terminase large subunit GpA-like protein
VNPNSRQNTVELFNEVCSILTPPDKISVTEWADRFRYLPQEAAAEPGKYSSRRTPFAREIMNAVSDPHIRRVVVKAASQVSKTEIILNSILYFAAVDPCPMLWVLPREDDAKSYSLERLDPSIRDTPEAKAVFVDPSDRKRYKVQYKAFKGGYIALVSSEVPSALAGRPVRVLLMDEIDRFPISAGKEGDPVEIASARTRTFWNRKEILTSSPTVEGTSRIEDAYQESTMEEWFVPCPDAACRHYQTLSFWRLDFKTLKHKCAKCEKSFDQVEWQANNLFGEWRGARTVDRYGRKLTARGFHLSSMVSPYAQWSEMVQKYQEAKKLADQGDITRSQVFHNTWLGECWKENFSRIGSDDLYDRREEYPAELPDEVVYLTAGVDTQDDRIECTVYGFGHDHECWGIEHIKLLGDTTADITIPGGVWSQLAEFLDRDFAYGDGVTRKIDRVFQDSGGHSTSKVYEFTRHKTPRLFPSKGSSIPGCPIIKTITRTSQTRQPLVLIGTDTAKAELSVRLQVPVPGPGSVHYPKLANGNPVKGFDEGFFVALTNEAPRPRLLNGTKRIIWSKINDHEPNEAWDCFVLAKAALTHAENQGLRLNSMSRPRGGNAPKFVPKWQTNEQEPVTRLMPVQTVTTASTNATTTAGQPAPEPKFVPKWRTN